FLQGRRIDSVVRMLSRFYRDTMIRRCFSKKDSPLEPRFPLEVKFALCPVDGLKTRRSLSPQRESPSRAGPGSARCNNPTHHRIWCLRLAQGCCLEEWKRAVSF